MMLTISSVIVLMYGWPMFADMQKLKNDRSEAISKLEDIKAKSENIVKLRSIAVDEKSEDVRLIYQYLPKVKKEEAIIDSVNYLALNTPGIIIAELDIEKDGGGNKNAASSNVTVTSSPTTAAAGSVSQSAAANVFSYIPVKLTVVGKYDETKLFLSRLDNMLMYNSVSSLTIEHVKKDDTKKIVAAPNEDATQQATEGTDAGNESAESELLKTDIAINFVYFSPIKSRAGQKYDIFSRNNFDLAVLDKIRSNAEINVPDLEIRDSAGTPNPFKLN